MKRMSKSLIALFMIFLVGCSINPSQSIQAQPQSRTDFPTAIKTSMPMQPLATETHLPTLIPTVTINGIYVLPNSDAGNINVRSGPMTSFSIVGALKAGEKANVIGIDPNGQWVLIEFPQAAQRKAWVFKGLVNMNGGTPPIIDPATGNVIVPTQSLQMGNPQAIEAIKQYLQQDTIEITYLGQTDNLNNPDQKVGRYHAGSDDFLVELQTNHIVEIDVGSGIGLTGANKQYTSQELKQMAEKLIAILAPHVNLAALTFQLNSKGQDKSIIYFFQWENTATGSIVNPRIYVAYNLEGKVVGYINTLGIE